MFELAQYDMLGKNLGRCYRVHVLSYQWKKTKVHHGFLFVLFACLEARLGPLMVR